MNGCFVNNQVILQSETRFLQHGDRISLRFVDDTKEMHDVAWVFRCLVTSTDGSTPTSTFNCGVTSLTTPNTYVPVTLRSRSLNSIGGAEMRGGVGRQGVEDAEGDRPGFFQSGAFGGSCWLR